MKPAAYAPSKSKDSFSEAQEELVLFEHTLNYITYLSSMHPMDFHRPI